MVSFEAKNNNEKVVSYPHTIYSLTLCADRWVLVLHSCWISFVPHPHLPNPKTSILTCYHHVQLLLLLLPLLIKTHDASFLPPSSNP
jgi:hypothetical protein